MSDEESFYGALSSEQDPPIFACRFAEAAGYEHILALANEDGRVVIQVFYNVNAYKRYNITL